MSSHFIVPTFSKSTPNKVHYNLKVSDQNSISHPTPNHWIFAIASESIPATVDGEYVFAVRIDNIACAAMMIGVTPTESFDANKESYPGYNGMTGFALFFRDGNFYPASKPNLIDRNICNQAKEVIIVVTISTGFLFFGGRKCTIRWIVDGISSPNHDCTAECNGRKLFPAVFLNEQTQQITAIPIDQITIRNDEINKLIEKFPKQSSINQGAVANNNNQQQSSSAAFAQLQQELEKERKRADLAETQLQQKDQELQKKDQEIQDEKKISAVLTTQVRQKDLQLQQNDQQLHDEKNNTANLTTAVKQKDQQLQQKDSEITQLKQQLLTLQSQLNNNNNSLVPSSPFVKGKPYQIDFAANGLPIPADRSTFGSLLPVAQTSPIFLEAKKLMRKLGAFLPTQKPVAGFTLECVDVIAKSVAGFEDVLHNLQQFRTHGGGIFNPSTTKYSAEQLQVLIYLNKLFLDRPSDAHDKAPDLINVFHGTKRGVLQSAVNGLVAVRSTDAGFFGLGAYTTPNIEYAARYAMGEFNPTSTDFTPRADGSFPVIWCVAAVGVCYPLTRDKDYGQNKQWNGMGVSDFFGSPLKSDANGKFDCHCVLVNESANYQSVPRHEMQYVEIVFDQTSQVLPIAVLWMKPV